MYAVWILALALSWTFSAGVSAEDAALAADPPRSVEAVPGIPFREGDVVRFDQVDKLEDYLPAPFWENREFFFFEGMALEIGPSFREYGEADAYRNVTNQNRGKSSIVIGGNHHG